MFHCFFCYYFYYFRNQKLIKHIRQIKDDKELINVEYLEKSDENYYILGEGDVLKIKILEIVEDLSRIEATVDPQGKILLLR